MVTKNTSIFAKVKEILFSPTLIFLLPFALPLLMLFLANTESFILGWNEGHGGLSFALLFLLIEWLDSHKKLKLSKSRRKLIGKLICLGLMIFYFVFLYIFDYYVLLESVGESLNVEGLLSWARMWDYIVYTIFMIGIIYFTFDNSKVIRFFPTPIVYTLGMASILFLDAMLPHSQLGIFEGVVSVILTLVVGLLNMIGIGVNRMGNQALLVHGEKGTLRVSMYWPCVGILSMLIYLLVIVILMIKLNTTLRRKIIYAILGAVGTFFINVIRIFLIIYYGACISVNLRLFHETIGEVLFIIWIVAFIFIVTEIESHRIKKQRAINQKGLIGSKNLTK